MRYRRMSVRYAMLIAPREPNPFGDPWAVNPAVMVLAQPRFRPRADVYETVSAFHVTVDLAGVDPEELDVALFEDAVVIEGRRRMACEPTGGVYHVAEIPQGPLRLAVTMPVPIDPDSADARYDRGLLCLTIQKAKDLE